MSDTQWLPIQAVEGLLWRRGAYYVEKNGEAHRMNDGGSFPSLYEDIQDNGKFEPDPNPGTEYPVDDPLKIFESLANSGKGCGLSIYKPQYVRDGSLVAKKGRSDKRLLRFIRDYGIPADSAWWPVQMGYTHDASYWIGHSDIGRGNVGEDLRTTAAIAHLCWTLWEELRKLEAGDKQAKSEAMANLKSHLHEIDVSTLDINFSESLRIPEISGSSLWTFFPNLTSKDATCHWATFASSNATSEEILLRHGVYTTISKVAQWYLASAIKLVLVPLNGEASPPEMMVRMSGLRSYLWMHFLSAVVGRGVPKFYFVQCRQDESANGCGRWFYSESAKAGRCHECQTLINRVEQRIKRNRSLKGQKEQLFEEERARILQTK